MKNSHPISIVLAALLLVPLPGEATQPSPGILPELDAHRFSINQVAQRQRRRLRFRVGVRPSRSRLGAFSRSGICDKQARITAFVPPPRKEENVAEDFAAVDTTLSARPTLWVHLASMPKNAQVQFTLQDAAGRKEFYNKKFTLSARSGILGIRLPTSVPELKLGEVYLWQLRVQCGDDSRPDTDPSIGSWIQRIAPNQIKSSPDFDPKPLVQELARASDRDKPALYAALGVWQDAVTSLIALQQKQPNNKELKEDWRNLLVGAQMSEYVNAPILGTK